MAVHRTTLLVLFVLFVGDTCSVATMGILYSTAINWRVAREVVGLAGYEIDPEAETFGYWRCILCNSKFFDGPRAVHNPGCKDAGMCKSDFEKTYQNCIRVIHLHDQTQ
jgi:hypothetical protein